MNEVARYKAISVTVPSEMERALQELCRREIRKKSEVVTEALRLYFRARGGKSKSWSLVLPVGDEEHGMNDHGAFTDEWGGEHDKVYDVLAK
jgi:Arc/MetJ-type ribon-helix-helix transcriptional regulator